MIRLAITTMRLLRNRQRLFGQIIAIIAFVSLSNGVASEHLPKVPGAMLLVGYDPFSLVLTTETATIDLEPNPFHLARYGNPIYASMSRDGRLVAYARLKALTKDNSEARRIVAISTYSISDRKIVEHLEGPYTRTVSISPDGSKIAFIASEWRPAAGRQYEAISQIHVLNLQNGQQIVGPQVA